MFCLFIDHVLRDLLTSVPFPTIVSYALCFTGWRFEGSGLDLIRGPTIIVLACCTRVEPAFLRPTSTTATISGKGIHLGIVANLRRLANTPSTTNRGLDDMFTIHLSVGYGRRVPAVDCSYNVSNVLFC